MGVFSHCRKYVNELPKGQLFVTRSFLHMEIETV